MELLHMNRDAKTYNDSVADMFKDLPPFTITVNNGFDAAWISSAMLTWLTGDNEAAKDSLKLMFQAAEKFGAEESVSMFFNEGIKLGHRFPKCMKPLFIHMVGHALKKYNEQKEDE